MTITVSPQDFAYLRQLPVAVNGANGQPVRSALIVLTDAKNKREQRVLADADAGKTAFTTVPLGKAIVSATTGANGPKVTQEVTVAPGPGGVLAPIILTLPGDVPPLDAPDPASASPAPDPGSLAESPIPDARERADETQGSSWIGGVIGLVVLSGAAIWGLRAARARGLTVAGTLRQIGVEMPQDSAAAASAIGPSKSGSADLPPLPTLNDLPAAMPSVAAGAATGSGGDAFAATASTGPRLVGVAGSAAGAVIPISPRTLPVTLGRDANNTLALTHDNTVSRRHARIEARKDGSGFVIVDAGSSNGTYVNGVRADGPRPLHHGDDVQIGSARFRVEA
jgi:hypothetical protein